MAVLVNRRQWMGFLTLAGLQYGAGSSVFAQIRMGPNRLEPCDVFPKYKSHVRFYVRGNYRYCDSNGIPDHKVGRFPDRGCPNAIRPQDFHFRMPLYPHWVSKLIPVHNWVLFGVGLDGVVFDPGTADFWHHERNSIWNKTLLTGFGNLGLDASHAHVQHNGTYHYHGVPTELIRSLNGWGKVTLIGYAADGFPIYGPWGYVNAHDTHSGVRLLRSSYRLKRGDRPSPPAGPGGRYDGRYTGDFEYVAGAGDLDAANGRFGVTPEYPGGTYYYVVTYEFPFISRQFHGRPDRSFYKHPGGRSRGGRGGRAGGGGGWGRLGGGRRRPPFGPGGPPFSLINI